MEAFCEEGNQKIKPIAGPRPRLIEPGAAGDQHDVMRVGEQMKKLKLLLGISMAALLGSTASFASSTKSGEVGSDAELTGVISALDGAVFDAFNHCSKAGQLEKHATFFAPEVEFYHDTGGVTWNREEMIANTQKNVCGNFRRELVPGTLEVFPIKDFGALERGTHRFCQFTTGACEGMADFVIIWRLKDGKWQITRVLSFGHRAIDAPGS
jgi:hypothetical protein